MADNDGDSGRAEATAFAAERRELVFPAVAAAALKKGVELVLDELRHIGAGLGLRRSL